MNYRHMTVLFICVCVCVSLDVWQGVWHARFAARILNTFNILNLIISDVFVTIFVAISKQKKKKQLFWSETSSTLWTYYLFHDKFLPIEADPKKKTHHLPWSVHITIENKKQMVHYSKSYSWYYFGML